MTTKEYLCLIQKYEKVIWNKLAEYCRIKSAAYSICISNDSERVQTSGTKDKTGQIVSKMVDLEAEIDSLTDERKKIVKQIESINDPLFYDVLAKRYILTMSNQEIAFEAKLSEEETSRAIKDALKAFEAKFLDKYSTLE